MSVLSTVPADGCAPPEVSVDPGRLTPTIGATLALGGAGGDAAAG
jgi:hypothetical protein